MMQYIWRYRFRRVTLIAIGCGSFLAGIWLAWFGMTAAWWEIVLTLLLIMLFGARKNLTVACLVLILGLLLGCSRGAAHLRKLQAYQALYYRNVSVSVQALDDAVYGTNAQLSFTAGNITLADGTPMIGSLQVSGFGTNAVFQGDELTVEGKLYPSYGIYRGRISFAKLTVADHRAGIIPSIRRKFSSGLQTALPEPLAPFALGLLIGQRATLPDDVKQDLLMVGLTHIIAVSGYNLTIMLEASKKLLGKCSKRLATGLSLGFIMGFLILTGSSASIVRAAIVSMLSIATGYYGRRMKPLNTILIAAVITGCANPAYVWFDSSWYLSFLAFFGVLIVGPLIHDRLPEKLGRSLIVSVAVESICAEIMTLPFILHTFGQMSFVGLLGNILVTTLVPLAMLLSTIAGLAGMYLAALTGWVAWPAKELLTYMLDMAHSIAGLPHIFVENLAFSFAEMISMYVLVAIISVLLTHKTTRRKYAIITDRND